MEFHTTKPTALPCISGYTTKKLIGKGSFSLLYEVESISPNPSLHAAKVIDFPSKCPSLRSSLFQEAILLQKLRKVPGFPRVKEFQLTPGKEILIMSRLGANVHRLAQICGGTFSLKTVLMLGIQAIKLLEAVHSLGFVHRDIKPENFLISCSKTEANLLHLIDFGFACPFLDKNKQHVPYTKHATVPGTVYFLSVYGHLGIQSSRRDDLISLAYMLIELFKGDLPWNCDFLASFEEEVELIYKIKSQIPVETLCQGLPEEFQAFVTYVSQLSFVEKPDYELLVGLFEKMLSQRGLLNDGHFDWIENSSIDLKGRKIVGVSPSLYMKNNGDSGEFEEIG